MLVVNLENHFITNGLILFMQTGEVIIYQSPDGQTAIDVKLENETVWLSQAQMQHLFNQTKQNNSLHIKNIFSEKELDRNSTVKEYLTVQKEGKRTKVRAGLSGVCCFRHYLFQRTKKCKTGLVAPL
jgi:hypothetical protein